MSNKEIKLAAKMLDRLSYILSNRGCNDWKFPEDWSDEERASLIKDYHEFNGDYDDFEKPPTMIMDFCVASILSEKLSKLGDES